MNNPSVGAKPLSRAGKVRFFIKTHKIISAVVLIVVVGGGWYWYSSASTPVKVTKYVVENATTGTVISSVSGSGQMQAGTTISLKASGSGNVVAIPVTVGEKVSAGQLLVQLDTTNEARALTQAKLSLQSAQLSLAKLTEAPATTTLLQDQNAVTQNETDLVNASATLQRDYQSGFDELGTAFVDFQNLTLGLQNFVNGNDISKSQTDPNAYVNLMPAYLQVSAGPYANDVASTFAAAGVAYTRNLADYHAASRSSDPATLDALFSETYQTAQTISNAVKAAKDLLNYVVNNYPSGQGLSQLPTITTTLQANMGNYTNTANNDVSSLSSAINTISNDKTSLTNAQLSLDESSSSLATLVAGADTLDVQSSQLSIQQQELSLQTAQQNYDNDFIRAPIAGVVASIPAVIGEAAPSPAVTMVGGGQVAEVTLNEVDAAKVQVGDKATLSLDAITGLSVAGTVVELDPVGTVSQGVVNYNTQISLAVPNDQIKPGMSVTANIVTQVDQNVIAVPSSAIVTQGGTSYILEPSTPLSATDLSASATGGAVLSATPVRVPVTVGLTDATQSEITSGIKVGDQIIVQTIAGTTATTATTGGTSALRALGGAGLGGGAAGGATFRAGGAGL